MLVWQCRGTLVVQTDTPRSSEYRGARGLAALSKLLHNQKMNAVGCMVWKCTGEPGKARRIITVALSVPRFQASFHQTMVHVVEMQVQSSFGSLHAWGMLALACDWTGPWICNSVKSEFQHDLQQRTDFIGLQ